MEPSTLVGRDLELERLDGLLVPAALVTVLGTAGTGKSRLARALVAQRPDVVLFDPFDGGRDARAAIASLRGRHPVLVTGRDVVGLPGEQVLALPPLPRCDAEALLATLVDPTDESFTALLEIADGLPGALVLLAAEAGRSGPAEVAASASAVLAAHRARGLRLPRSVTMALLERWAEQRSGHPCRGSTAAARSVG